MYQIDKEGLERLLPELRALNIDTDNLPEPNSQEWQLLEAKIAKANRSLAQEFAGLAYDPEEQQSSELVAEQVRRSQAKSGLKDSLAPLLTKKTVNGETVPNYPLIRSLVVAAGLVAAGAFLLYTPSDKKEVAQSASSTTTASSTTVTEAPGGDVAGVTGPGEGVARNPAFESIVAGEGQTPETASGAATDSLSPEPTASLSPEPTASLTPEPEPTYATGPVEPVQVYPETQVYGAPEASGGGSVPEVTVTPAANFQELTPEEQAALTAYLTGDSEDTAGDVKGAGKTGNSAATAVSAPVETLPESNVVLLPGDAPTAAAPVLSADGGSNQAAAARTLSSSGGAQGGQGGSSSARTLSSSGGAQGGQGGSSSARTLSSSGGAQGGQGEGGAGRGLIAQGGTGGQQGRTLGLKSVGAAAQAGTGSTVGLKSAGQGQKEQAQAQGQAEAAGVSGAEGGSEGAPAHSGERLVLSAASTSSTGSTGRMTGSFSSGNGLVPRAGEVRPGALSYGVAMVVGAQGQSGGEGAGDAGIPVYVRTADGVVWKGSPRLDGAKRVQIVFTQALVGGEVQNILADAYGMDGYPGIKANISTKAPTLAADILNGFGKGALSFAQASLTRTTKVESNGNTTVSEQGQPNFWVTAGSGVISEAARFPQGQGGLISVAEVKPGTPIRVVVRGQ